MTDAGPELETHPEYDLVEARLTQTDRPQTMWAAAITGLSDEYGLERDFIAYIGPDEDTDSGMCPVGQSSVIEISVAHEADREASTWYYAFDRGAGIEQIDEDEDEIEEVVKSRMDIIESDGGSDRADQSDVQPIID